MHSIGGPLSRQTITEKLALAILARDGIAAIWKLNEAAADAHQTGYPHSAAAVLEIADAAEAALLGTRERLLDRLIAVGAQVGVAGYPLA
jgi:HD superfamily phosphodiesterase